MKRYSLLLLMILLSLTSVMAQNIVKGKITDSDGKPLAYANIVITHSVENGSEIPLRTQIGAVSDFEGNYVITGVPMGSFKINFIYIGYIEQSAFIGFDGSETNKSLDVILKSESIGLEEVVVTAQAKGQLAAVNQQVNALTIKNVVSSDRIRQNPDANAAEALGRLPGLTVTRNGGEANGIVVRGMQGYNNVTINGVDVPVSLTSISQYALQNVEVFKSITADMDASSPAGSVNLKLGTAADKNSTNVMVQGGYSGLNNTCKNYKVNIASNHRFFDKKFGISLNLSSESTDRSTEQLLAGIGVGDQSLVEGEAMQLQTGSVRLRDVDKTVKRNSAILTTDYRFSSTSSVEWSNILTQTPGGPLNVDHLYVGGSGVSMYNINDNTGNKGFNYSSILTAKHLLGKIKVDYSASFGYAQNNSELRSVSFVDLTAYESTLNIEQMQTLSHREYVDLAQIENTPESINEYGLANIAFAQPGMTHKTSESKNMNIDARINMELPYKIGDMISGNLKWGGRYKCQDYDKESYGVRKESHFFPEILLGITPVPREDGSLWNDDISIPSEGISDNGQILGSYLLDQSDYNDNFLDDAYSFGWYPNMDRVNEVLDWYDDMTNYAYNRGQEYWQPIWSQIMQLQKEDFNGNAQGTIDHIMDHYAAYVMTKMKIGTKLDFVPGLRYEKSHYDMNTWNIRNEIISSLQLTGEPVNGTHDDEYLLPMLQLKYKPLKWLHGLFSYTETLKRPGVGQLMPYVYQDKINLSYRAGNPELKPEHWKSLDLGIAAHNRKIGLFSVTLFYKEVEDKIASSHWTKMSLDTETELGSFQPDQRVDVTEILNHPYEGYAKGIEVEWQTNFWYLPRPFSYFTLNLNYSYIKNKTTYVYTSSLDSIIGYGRGGRPITEKFMYDELVTGPMTNQPSHLFNASLGFSYKNFESYVSYQYIGEVFIQKTVLRETDPFKTAFHRIDLQARYKLPVKGLELMFNMANITDTEEVKKLRGDDRPTSIERYGWTSDIGLRFSF